MSNTCLEKILTIDDEPAIRFAIKSYLEDYNYEILEAENGLEGIELFRKQEPDLILVDLRMPEIDGLDVLNIVRKESIKTPVIVVSGTGVISDVVEAIRLGAWDYILKPIEDMTVLLHAAQNALEKARLMKENQIYQENLEELVAKRNSELAISEAKLEAIVSSLPDIIYRLNPKGEVTFVNSAIEKYGYNPDDLLGKSFMKLIHPDDQELAQYHIQERRTGERSTHSFEIRLLRKYNYPIKVEQETMDVNTHPVFLLESKGLYASDQVDSAAFLGTQGVARDITDRKLAEDALRESEQRLSMHIQQTPLGVVEVNLNTEIVSWNKSAEHIFGFKTEEVLGKVLKDYIVPEFLHDEIDTIWQQLIESKGGTRSTNQNINKKGELILCEWYNTPLVNQNNEVIGVASLVQDITKQKKLESQLQHAQKLEAVGRLAGGIAHDFNNLITAISGNAELALMNISPEDPLCNDFNEILDIADRAASLTRQLLAFSRKQIINPKEIKLNEAIANMENMLNRVIGEDVKLNIIHHPNLGIIKADPSQMEQILVNLVVNARDAMPEGGLITIETSNTKLSQDYTDKFPDINDGDYVLLSVNDTGIGMTKEIQSHIFEPFFTTKEETKGTGLGLATVYGIVKQNKGHIIVYSEVNQGTTFKIFLPITAKKQEKSEYILETDQKARGTESILVVEDDDTVRVIATKSLKQFGYNVCDMADSISAIELCKEKEGNFDIILTDVIMPGLNGPVMVDKILGIYPEIKILYMSGHTEQAIVDHGILKPGINFISKPFRAIDLARKVREVIDQDK